MKPQIVILGGGFAGVGAAQKLKKADVDVVVVDKHDYHTFQPLLYQLATGLLETSAVGHSLRDLVHDQDNATVHKATVTAVDLARARGAVLGDWRRSPTTIWSSGSARRSTSSEPKVPRSTLFPCTRSRMPCG